jgi:hypothetical protein
MSGVSLKTCWAIKKHWNKKFYYTFASCWLFLYNWFLFFSPPPLPLPPEVPVPILRPSQFYFELVHAAFTPGAKAAGYWNWSLISIWCGEWWVELKKHGFPTPLPARLYYCGPRPGCELCTYCKHYTLTKAVRCTAFYYFSTCDPRINPQ